MGPAVGKGEVHVRYMLNNQLSRGRDILIAVVPWQLGNYKCDVIKHDIRRKCTQ